MAGIFLAINGGGKLRLMELHRRMEELMAIKIKFYENVWIIRALMSHIKCPWNDH